jgi:hypothetical protein
MDEPLLLHSKCQQLNENVAKLRHRQRYAGIFYHHLYFLYHWCRVAM